MPLDFLLWGYVKGKIYANNPKTIPELKNNISGVIDEIGTKLCENVMQNFEKKKTGFNEKVICKIENLVLLTSF